MQLHKKEEKKDIACIFRYIHYYLPCYDSRTAMEPLWCGRPLTAITFWLDCLYESLCQVRCFKSRASFQNLLCHLQCCQKVFGQKNCVNAIKLDAKCQIQVESVNKCSCSLLLVHTGVVCHVKINFKQYTVCIVYLSVEGKIKVAISQNKGNVYVHIYYL